MSIFEAMAMENALEEDVGLGSIDFSLIDPVDNDVDFIHDRKIANKTYLTSRRKGNQESRRRLEELMEGIK